LVPGQDFVLGAEVAEDSGYDLLEFPENADRSGVNGINLLFFVTVEKAK